MIKKHIKKKKNSNFKPYSKNKIPEAAVPLASSAYPTQDPTG